MKFKYGNLVEVTDGKSFYADAKGAVVDHKTEQDMKKNIKEKYQLLLGKVGDTWQTIWFYEEQLAIVKPDAAK